LVKPWLKKELGFEEDTPDEVFKKEWERRTKHICKPCWELKYCPYGPLVEQFPLYSTKQEMEEYIEQLKKGLKSGELDKKVRRLIELSRIEITDIENLLKAMRKWAEEEIGSFNPEDYPEKVDYEQKCMIFGHYCPVFFVNEPFTETKEKRRITKHVPRTMLLRIIRRDNQTCQICGRPLMENEIEIDHIIPYGLGGPTDESNLRVLCRACNRAKRSYPKI